MFSDSQYGFLKHHSTEFAAMESTNKDDGKIMLAIFMDLSKAFDTLAHFILIDKLARYGFNCITLGWFTSYLTGHSQYVEIEFV